MPHARHLEIPAVPFLIQVWLDLAKLGLPEFHSGSFDFDFFGLSLVVLSWEYLLVFEAFDQLPLAWFCIEAVKKRPALMFSASFSWIGGLVLSSLTKRLQNHPRKRAHRHLDLNLKNERERERESEREREHMLRPRGRVTKGRWFSTL